jgi:hypothetical protein
MEKIYIVLLDTGTVGTISSDTLEGQHADAFLDERVTVHLHDENGMPIEADGVLVQVLDVSYADGSTVR